MQRYYCASIALNRKCTAYIEFSNKVANDNVILRESISNAKVH